MMTNYDIVWMKHCMKLSKLQFQGTVQIQTKRINGTTNENKSVVCLTIPVGMSSHWPQRDYWMASIWLNAICNENKNIMQYNELYICYTKTILLFVSNFHFSFNLCESQILIHLIRDWIYCISQLTVTPISQQILMALY